MTSAFLTPLRTEQLDCRLYQVLEPFTYRSALAQEIIEVPPGFITDFASVPRIPLVYWRFGNVAHRPAVVHDYLYQQCWPRFIADRILYEACRVDGVGYVRSCLIYRAVRIAGWSHYTC